MSVTIKDIAEKACVSQMTVSRVLRGAGRVSEDTRAKVRNIADELGYNMQGQVLISSRGRNGKSNRCLRVVMPFFGHGGQYTLMHEGDDFTKGHKSLSQRFSGALTSSLEQSGGWLQKVLVEDIDEFESSWPRWDADGIVLRQSVPTAWINRLKKIAPVVYASSFDTQNGVDVVYTNEHRSAANIFTYLSDNGHKSIVWFDVLHENGPYSFFNNHFEQDRSIDAWPPSITSVRHSAWANIRFLAGNCYSNEIMLLKRDYRSVTLADAAKEGLEQILKMNPRPTAIVSAHDNISLQFLNALQEMGMSVPDDMSLVGFCGFEKAINSQPSLSTVELPMEEIGAVVPELIERRLANPDAIAMSLQFETKLIKGDSVKNLNTSTVADGEFARNRSGKVLA
ncbi:MAG: LacI family DNA-binding transcriptional regulator [Sedimentisphaeraceae bacterium JB056]